MRPVTPRLLLPVALAGAAIAVAAPATTAQAPPDPPTVRVSFQFRDVGTGFLFRMIRLQQVPSGSTVVVRCLTGSGERCKGSLRKAFVREDVGGTLRVRGFDEKRIRYGRRLEAEISKEGSATVYKTIKVRRAGPSVTTECSAPGSDERGPC